MHWSERLLNIDRRVIYVIIAIVMIIPIIFPFGLPIRISRPTQQMFDAIDQLPQEKNTLMISADYNPQDFPEIHPMMVAILRHAFQRRIKVVVLCLYATELGLAEDAINTVSAEFNQRANSEKEKIINGRDYVFLGWKPPPVVPILGMGEDISEIFPKDYYGVNIDERPMMAGIRNYDDIGLLVCLSSGTPPLWYVFYAQGIYGVRVATGVTAVSVADFYPYLGSGQFTGLLEGMKGGAEYETLVEQRFDIHDRKLATEGMSAQSAAHLAIIVFIIIGNIGFFASRKQNRS